MMITNNITLMNGDTAPYNAHQREIMELINSPEPITFLPVSKRAAGTSTLLYNIAICYILNAFFYYKKHAVMKNVLLVSSNQSMCKYNYEKIMGMMSKIFDNHWSQYDIQLIKKIIYSSVTYSSVRGMRLSNVIIFDIPAHRLKNIYPEMCKLRLSMEEQAKIIVNIIQ